ncbi:tyrosine-type recombinase/integrase [Tolypothrix bouteillei VB521301_2]|uniref:tyrosine-type recombinase/integrase n=1 Tax=Tolypothrix bouteillei TaxID=1246981 RepID=UPI0005142F9F
MKTLAELVTEWLDVHHGKTRASYQNTIHKFLSFTSVDAIADIQIRHIREWLDSLQEADTTKVKHLNILKAFFSYVTSLEHPPISRSPIPKQFKLPKPKDTLIERILSPEDVDAMIDITCDSRNKLILKTLYLCGIRVSELCGLRWKDAIANRGGGGQINVYGKGGRTRRVHVPQELWQELMEFKSDALKDSPVFASATLRPLAPSHIDRVVKRAAAAAGLENAENVSPHWFRHSHATHALDEGVPVHLVKSVLGHTSLDTTSKYLHVSPDRSSGEVLVKRWKSK